MQWVSFSTTNFQTFADLSQPKTASATSDPIDVEMTEFATVPDSDHHATLDNPSGFVQAVRPFLLKA